MKSLITALLAFSSISVFACMTFVVGKKVSSTGRVIVGHNEDDWPPFEVRHSLIKAKNWPGGTFLPATKGCNDSIPQAPHTLACYWSEVKFEYGDGNADTFLNECGVIVVSDSGGNSTERMDDPTLLTNGGIKFNLRRAVGERAQNARDGVKILSNLVERYGYAPSARIYTIADKNEAWLVQVVHGRNYVAVRCPDDEITIMPNLYTVHALDAWPEENVIVSSNLLENARKKGFWNGKDKFDFAAAYQGSYDYGEEHAFEHPNNTGRFRQAIRLISGLEWPKKKPFPFSVKPVKVPFSSEDLKNVLTAHNGTLLDGRHQLESWSICSSTTIESEICEFAADAKDNIMIVAPGRGCETAYKKFRPFTEGLPTELDDSSTADERLQNHVMPMTNMPYFTPAPGRNNGRVYYYIPSSIDFAKPSPLLVFLHGGDDSTPDSAVELYFGKNGTCLPAFSNAPFIVVAPSAPPAPDGSRWSRTGVSKFIDATIEDAKNRFNIDGDRIFLGGHSMGGFGAYHLSQIMADRFAGIWMSSGAWWESDFRSLYGTPVFIQHGNRDTYPDKEYFCGHHHARLHSWCGTAYARAADKLMTKYGVEHVYREYHGSHSISCAGAQEAIQEFFNWAKKQKRDPYSKYAAIITPNGAKHPDIEDCTTSRWLEITGTVPEKTGTVPEKTGTVPVNVGTVPGKTGTVPGKIEVDAIVLEGPDLAKTIEDFNHQTYRLVKKTRVGASIVAENQGNNIFKVETKNVKSFRIFLAPQMGDMDKPFTVNWLGHGTFSRKAEFLCGRRDYTGSIEIIEP